VLTAKLEAIVDELRDAADRRERAELLIDLASSLPPWPERLAHLKDPDHRVPECVAPVYMVVELEGDRVRIHAEVPEEAPTTRGFVAMLVEGLDGATVAEVLATPNDLVERAGMLENLGMQRQSGFSSIVRRLKAMASHAQARQADRAAH
jgi:cysteine desulfuration protein SufE